MRRTTQRRTLWVMHAVGLLALGAVALALLPGGAGRAQQRSEHVHQRVTQVVGVSGAREKVLVTFPRRSDRKPHPPGHRYPLVVALHGLGETQKGPERGFLGWNLDYWLPDAFGAFGRAKVGATDYRSHVSDQHLARVNRGLAHQGFAGLIVVTPFTPDLRRGVADEPQRAAWMKWVATDLLRAIRERFAGAARDRASTGIDGVSLGGLVALETGFRHPEAFASIGGIQPAVRGEEPRLARLAAAAVSPRRSPRIRLLTSHDDPYRRGTERLSAALRQASVGHALHVFPGPHGYSFNRGPGALELLRFHHETLPRERWQTGPSP